MFDPGDGMKPFEVVGYKVQFTQMEGDNAGCCFCENEIGFGLNEHTKLEGFRKNNLIATWMLGPVLPLKPRFDRVAPQAGYRRQLPTGV